MTPAEEAEIAIVAKAAEHLIDHFDSVQILVTRHDPMVKDGTISIDYGLGNWFTRYGQCRDLVIKHEERTRLKINRTE